MTRAIILTGADRYDGKWHDHAATSQRIAEILGEAGIDARLRSTHPRTFGDLATVSLAFVYRAYDPPEIALHAQRDGESSASESAFGELRQTRPSIVVQQVWKAHVRKHETRVVGRALQIPAEQLADAAMGAVASDQE